MSLVTSQKDNGIGIITFNNPPKGFLTSEMIAETIPMIEDLDNDDSIKTVIFTGGIKGIFIKHFSVEEILAMSDLAKERRKKGLYETRHTKAPLRMFWENIDNMKKPTIAAINGYCGGGGCELALACDIRLAEKGDYTIGQMEILVGIIPGAGGTTRLARLVGPGKALEWVLRGRTFYPDEAKEEGLVHHVVQKNVLGEAKKIASEFLDKPPLALQSIKQVIKNSWNKSTQESVDEEGDLFANLISNDDQAVEMMQNYIKDGHNFDKF